MELLGKQHVKQSNRRDGKKELEADMGGGEDLKVEFVARNMSFDEIVCDPTDRIHGQAELDLVARIIQATSEVHSIVATIVEC